MSLIFPMRSSFSPSMAPSAFLLLLMTASPTYAGIAGTPLSLGLSQSLQHDSNFERLEEGRADTLSTTRMTVALEKEYGRQSYKADVTASINRFKQLTQYNNDGFDINLRVSSDVGSSSRVSFTHTRNRSLQDFDVQGTDLRRKEVTTDIATSVVGQHGLYSRWYLVGSLDASKAAYETATVNARTSTGGRVGVRFTPTDLLYFEMGLRKTTTKYPYSTLFSGTSNATVGDEVGRVDLDFQSSWTVTGYSLLRTQVNWTDETHDTVEPGKPDDSARDFRGITGSATWEYTPRGKVGYTLKFSRDTNNGGGFSTASRTSLRNKLITNLDASALWQLTSKFKLNGNIGIQHLKEDELQSSNLLGASLQDSASGVRRQLTVGALYFMDRSVSFGCSLAHARRTPSLFSAGYISNSSSCSASFSME